MISKVVIFIYITISWLILFENSNIFSKEFTLVGPCLSHEIQSKTDFSSEPTPFKCAYGFFDRSNWHVIESFNTPTLIGRLTGAVYSSGCKGGLA